MIENVKQLRSVAVECITGEEPRAYGPFRLVKYAQFLLKEILPLHDRVCREEGELMLAHVAGDANAPRMLAQLSGRTDALYNHLWHKA